jgi:hypothetical protein
MQGMAQWLDRRAAGSPKVQRQPDNIRKYIVSEAFGKRSATGSRSTKTGRPEVLFKRRCPHTGVVNFYASTEPLLAAGSIVAWAPSHYVWHCHIADDHCGAARDAALAEAELRRVISATTAARRGQRGSCA